MKDIVRKLEADAVNGINAIAQFRAFTAFGYFFLENKITAGEKILLLLGDPRFEFEVKNETQLLENIRKYKDTYLADLSFVHCVSVFEWFFFDLLRALLKEIPERMGGKKQCDLSMILAAIDKNEIVDKVVDREINNIKYQSTKDWFEYLNNIIKIDFPDDESVLILAEIKASRDIVIHNNHLVNKIYTQKSGKFSRYKEGDMLSVSEKEYVNNSAAFLKGIVKNIAEKLIEKY